MACKLRESLTEIRKVLGKALSTTKDENKIKVLEKDVRMVDEQLFQLGKIESAESIIDGTREVTSTPVAEESSTKSEPVETKSSKPEFVESNTEDSAKILKRLMRLNKKFAIKNLGSDTTFSVEGEGTGGAFNRRDNTIKIKKGSEGIDRTMSHELIHSLQYGMVVDLLSNDSKKFMNKMMKKFATLDGIMAEEEYKSIWKRITDKSTKGMDPTVLEMTYLAAVTRGDYKSNDAVEKFGREFTAIVGSSPRFRQKLFGNVEAKDKMPFKMLVKDILNAIKNVKNLIKDILNSDPEDLRDNPDYDSALRLLDEYLQFTPDVASTKENKGTIPKVEEIKEKIKVSGVDMKTAGEILRKTKDCKNGM